MGTTGTFSIYTHNVHSQFLVFDHFAEMDLCMLEKCLYQKSHSFSELQERNHWMATGAHVPSLLRFMQELARCLQIGRSYSHGFYKHFTKKVLDALTCIVNKILFSDFPKFNCICSFLQSSCGLQTKRYLFYIKTLYQAISNRK